MIDIYEYIDNKWRHKRELLIKNKKNAAINLGKESLRKSNFICNGRYILSTKPTYDKLTVLNFSVIDLNTGILYTKEDEVSKKMVLKVPTTNL